MKTAIFKVSLSIILGMITLEIVSALKHLPYNETLVGITDALSLPGGLIARVFYPEGVHTGHGAPYWGLVAACSNVLFYVALWFLILSLLKFPRSKAKVGRVAKT